MHFRFLLSDPHGGIELSPDDLARPFLISPQEQHPFLTLKDYFGALQSFVLDTGREVLCAALNKQGIQADTNLSDISEVIIRSEKHGAFYHIASIEIIGFGKYIKFALTSALSGPAKESLGEEYLILQQLSEITSDFIPVIYGIESVTRQTDAGSEDFLMVLGEWLDGYHEWHLTDDPESNTRKIQLWDYEKGYRLLAAAESRAMLRQVACILTCYYDQASFQQIYPWHHGAGDFVVKAEHGAVSVKLITARQHAPLVQFNQAEATDRLVAAIHFLLNLSLRIRLDRVDGVGEPAWLDDFATDAAVEGFFDGLAAAQGQKRLMIGPPAEFLAIMQTFDAREMLDMYESLLQIYAAEDQDDFRLIQTRLPDHAGQLLDALQSFSLTNLNP